MGHARYSGNLLPDIIHNVKDKPCTAIVLLPLNTSRYWVNYHYQYAKHTH